MADLSFGQQVWLAVIDKAALGAAALLFGYAVNRRLEGYKSREALRMKMAEQRIPKIAENVDRFAAIEASTRAAVGSDWMVALMDAQHSGNASVHFARLWDARPEFRRDHIRQLEQAREALNRDRFWVGAKLTDALIQQNSEISRLHSMAAYAEEYAREMTGLSSVKQLQVTLPGAALHVAVGAGAASARAPAAQSEAARVRPLNAPVRRGCHANDFARLARLVAVSVAPSPSMFPWCQRMCWPCPPGRGEPLDAFSARLLLPEATPGHSLERIAALHVAAVHRALGLVDLVEGPP